MKKADLTRRAEQAASRAYRRSRLYQPDHEEAHAAGFEEGFLAARSDLRRDLALKNRHPLCTPKMLLAGVARWLRPIR